MALTVVGFFGVASCNRHKSADEMKQDTRHKGYRGELTIAVDESLGSIMKQDKEVFEYLYDSVKVNLIYGPEKEMLEAFRHKKATLLILARELDKPEIAAIREIDTIAVREQPVAYDAVALIGNPEFDDKDLDMAQLSRYFDPRASANGPRLVFDGKNSSTVNFVVQKLGYKEKVSSNVYALQSAQEVIDYVSANKNVVGFVPYNLVSDADDQRAKKVLESVKILSLRAQSADSVNVRVRASQGDIAEGIYPLIRTVNTITYNTYDDNLELLMVSFLAKEKGARIFLKAGLVPVKIPERYIIVNEGEGKK